MKTKFRLLLLFGLAVVTAGCGLVSGTIFIAHDVSGDIVARSGASPLDQNFGGVVVDLTENDDWDRVDIDGVEDMCIRLTAQNHLADSVSGEVWITSGSDTTGLNSPAAVQSHGFRIFHGMALAPSQTRLFTCAETLALLENVDLLSEAVQTGHFAVWGIGDQTTYHITYSGIVFGMHVTGSL